MGNDKGKTTAPASFKETTRHATVRLKDLTKFATFHGVSSADKAGGARSMGMMKLSSTFRRKKEKEKEKEREKEKEKEKEIQLLSKGIEKGPPHLQQEQYEIELDEDEQALTPGRSKIKLSTWVPMLNKLLTPFFIVGNKNKSKRPKHSSKTCSSRSSEESPWNTTSSSPASRAARYAQYHQLQLQLQQQQEQLESPLVQCCSPSDMSLISPLSQVSGSLTPASNRSLSSDASVLTEQSIKVYTLYKLSQAIKKRKHINQCTYDEDTKGHGRHAENGITADDDDEEDGDRDKNKQMAVDMNPYFDDDFVKFAVKHGTRDLQHDSRVIHFLAKVLSKF